LTSATVFCNLIANSIFAIRTTMAQYQKDEVRERILEAALDHLAREGYAGCSIAAIARDAGLSVGNLYRYFAGKDELVAAALPAALLDTLAATATGRLLALAEEGRAKGERPEAPLRPDAGQLSAFAGRRRELLFLLDGAAGSPCEGFAEKLKSSLVESFREYEGSKGSEPRHLGKPAREAALAAIYASLLSTFASILRAAAPAPEGQLTEALSLALRYHLSGMKALLEMKGE
jgi:AcrR family transcriptional regulator